MFGSTDYNGIAAVLLAVATIIGSISGLIAAIFAGRASRRAGAVHDEIQTGNGRTIGQQSSAVADVIAPTTHDTEPASNATPPSAPTT